ncbi:WD40 repeat-containing protein [Nitzschia inconspicua]|uniref:WD40 repeat-containing protein n=1 Tax=Nitzschia inconspicua TaxID=303405 RepID=A0A9K3Q8W7_9STRA|nr:WD40 repeat-containing protein [Nitzschia inconspicua]
MADSVEVTCELLHHGAAANSSPKAVTTIPSLSVRDVSDPLKSTTQLVYASHLMLNVAEQLTVKIIEKEEKIWTVTQTLRTKTSTTAEMASAAANVSTLTAKRVITCVKSIFMSSTKESSCVVVVCGFSDGSLTSWSRDAEGQWAEHVLPNLKAQLEGRSITDLDGYFCHGSNMLLLTVCSSGGAHFLAFEGTKLMQEKNVISAPCNVCRYQVLRSDGMGVFLVGTAAPRHNKVHVLTHSHGDYKQAPVYCGALSGHEDWITCFDWITPSTSNANTSYLASGSQDAKIRLWKWITKTHNITDISTEQPVPNIGPEGSDEEDEDDDEDMIQGEARLEIPHSNNQVTSVYLEALLVGHEEMVTSLAWHPNPQQLYQQDLILISASMDRSIFIWSTIEGVWTPVSRVGSAGGILGGSIGSSLLGYLTVKVDPSHGSWIMGHAYGGALHFFSCETTTDSPIGLLQDQHATEEQVDVVQWRAQACLTGHFEEVTDLCWEASQGDYLITVSNDQTCRIWALIRGDRKTWIEIARPQVHGYNLSAVTSLSTGDHMDLIATGADEKEIRVFDGTLSFLRMLQAVTGSRSEVEVESTESRVERAYIPALGLTNKASAADGADEDTSGASKSNTSLPLERDLGSTSLWPEVRKLFGHNSEIARLTSTLTSRTSVSSNYLKTHFNEVLIASTTKARDVETANIRLWNSHYRCVQVLKGGHRSTVTALSFSPDGSYLASSGKDRRLCIWKATGNGPGDGEGSDTQRYSLACAIDSCHKRIVWSAHFCPYDPTILVTGSRDASVKLWKVIAIDSEDGYEIEMKEYSAFVPRNDEDAKNAAVTSLSLAPLKLTESRGLLAIGFEDGLLQLWSVPIDWNENLQPTLVSQFDPNICHIGAVNKIAWKPVSHGNDVLVLATCSADCGCRVFSIKVSR